MSEQAYKYKEQECPGKYSMELFGAVKTRKKFVCLEDWEFHSGTMLNAHFMIPTSNFDFSYSELRSGFSRIFSRFVAGLGGEPIDWETSPRVQHRNIELDWLEKNRDKLSKYDSSWICIEGTKLIATDKTLKAVIDKAKGKGILSPFVYYIQESLDDSTLGI